MRRIVYSILWLFLLFFGCENTTIELKKDNVQHETSSTQQTTSQKENDIVGQDSNDEITQESTEEVSHGTNQESEENIDQRTDQIEKITENQTEDNKEVTSTEKEDVASQGSNPETTENPSQETNQDNNINQGEIPTEKPDNYTGTIWVQGVTKDNGWVDVNKWKGFVASEYNTCWMATSANVLADYYRRNNYQSTPSASDIYKNIYINSGGDAVGTYIDGIPKYVERTEVGIIYPTGLNRNCLCLSNCDDIQVMSKALIENLHKGAAGIKFVWFGSDGSGHALTLWGATFEKGILTKVHVTDSDDKYEGIKEYTIKTGTDREKAVIEVTDYSPKAKLREVYIPF